MVKTIMMMPILIFDTKRLSVINFTHLPLKCPYGIAHKLTTYKSRSKARNRNCKWNIFLTYSIKNSKCNFIVNTNAFTFIHSCTLHVCIVSQWLEENDVSLTINWLQLHRFLWMNTMNLKKRYNYFCEKKQNFSWKADMSF